MTASTRTAVVFLPALLLALSPLVAQKQPRVARTAAKALADFAAVADRPEVARQPKIAALGRYAAPEVDEVLFAQLRQARTPGYRQAVVQAIGMKQREGAVAALAPMLDDSAASSSLLYSVGYALGGQGDAALPVLKARLADLPPQAQQRSTRASAVFSGLKRLGTPEAYAAIIDAGRSDAAGLLQTALQNLRGATKSPAVSEFRLECTGAKNVYVRVEAVSQLAAESHPRAKAAALEVYASLAGKMVTGHYAEQLAEVFAGLLAPDTFEPFVVVAAGAYERLDKILAPLAKKVDTVPGLVDWLLARGLDRKVPAERLVAMRLLGTSTDARTGATLVKLAASREPGMALAAMRALTDRGDRRVVPILRRALKTKDEARQVAALEGLHALLKDEPAWREELVALFKGRQDAPRVFAMDVLAGLQRRELLPEVYKMLEHKGWRTRAAAYDFCRLVRSPDSVEPLIARLDRESGRLREDCLDALKAITGYRLEASDRWRSWWKESKATFKMPPADLLEKQKSKRSAAAATTGAFFDIPLVSDRVTFVIDISGSMSAGMSTVSGSGKFSNTRIAEAQRQLERVVQDLPKGAVFNVIYFETGVKAFANAARKATRQNKTAAIGFVRALEARGGTNIHDALELAFEDDEVDTIYLLSDGAPSAGKITDPSALADAVARWNKVRRIRIHTIAIGSRSPMMERLAKESGGAHANVR